MKISFKKNIGLITVLTLVAIFLLMIAGCEQSPDGIIQSVQKVTPVAADFTITGLTAAGDGSPKTVSVKPKTGKSKGAITVYYEGLSGTVYPKSATAPSAAGKYAVTFDVAAADGFNAANGLKAGTFTISGQTASGVEKEDDDYTDDDIEETIEENTEETIEKPVEKPSDKPAEESTEKPDEENNEEITEETPEPFILVDFEDSVWNNSGYANRKVKWNGYEWTVSGVSTTTDEKDHRKGNRSVRLRGNSDDTDDNINRVELMDYLTNGIESISFDYASYSSHKEGILIIYYQKYNENWVEAGRITNIPSWVDGGSQMLNAKFEINIKDKVRFKIEKVSKTNTKTTLTSVNVDNILITY
jgi:hypothetical protein